jgi:hypothetical protein
VFFVGVILDISPDGSKNIPLADGDNQGKTMIQVSFKNINMSICHETSMIKR